MNAFTKILAALNLLGAAISISLLAATFFAQGTIVQRARHFALEKTRAYLEPVIPKTEKLLKNPLVAKALPASVEEKVESEIADYRASPDKWLLEIAEGTRNRASDFEFPEIKNLLARKALDFLTARIAGARDHFKRSFGNLILDLRIFTGIHAMVFIVAAGLCLIPTTPRLRFWLSAWSCLLLVTTLFSAGLYLNQTAMDWFWSILSNRYQGWGYAGIHLLITGYFAVKILPAIQFRGGNPSSRGSAELRK